MTRSALAHHHRNSRHLAESRAPGATEEGRSMRRKETPAADRSPLSAPVVGHPYAPIASSAGSLLRSICISDSGSALRIVSEDEVLTNKRQWL